jgi:hypothetical protein
MDDYMVKIDMSNAYYHIPIAEAHKRYLSLAYNDQIYNMNCLPFGLSSAPSIFSKVSNWVASLLRDKGIRIIVYLDDYLLLNINPAVLTQQAEHAVSLLKELGWHLNLEKSILEPRKQIEYLGLIWDSEANLITLPKAKITNISKIINHTLKKHTWSWMTAKHLFGKLNFASNAIPLGLLHCRAIQLAANHLPDHDKHRNCQLPSQTRLELLWWLENLTKGSTFQIAPPTTFITTDASDSGWGAIINNKKRCGLWDDSQKRWHSNRKKLWSLLEVLGREWQELKGKTVIFQTDNRITAAYIRKQGGTKSKNLLNVASRILSLANLHKIVIIPKYIPGRYNEIADSLSWTKNIPEWHLDKQSCETIFNKFGKPSIDLFASKASAVVPNYVSEDSRDQESQFTDAFSRTWNFRLGWIFPPSALIPRVLQHLNISQGHYLLIAPKWEKAFWKSELKRRATRPPFRIKNLWLHLRDLKTNRQPREMNNLIMEVWKIQAGPMK